MEFKATQYSLRENKKEFFEGCTRIIQSLLPMHTDFGKHNDIYFSFFNNSLNLMAGTVRPVEIFLLFIFLQEPILKKKYPT